MSTSQQKPTQPTREELLVYSINFSQLNKYQQELVQRVATRLKIPLRKLSAGNLVYDSNSEMILGFKKSTAFNAAYLQLLDDINDAFHSQKINSDLPIRNRLLMPHDFTSYTLTALDKLVNEDIDDFLARGDAHSVDVIKSRYGLDGTSSKTLKEIGDSYSPKLSVERARQFVMHAAHLMSSSCLINSDNLWIHIKDAISDKNFDVLPMLRKRFDSEGSYLLFIILICGLEPDHLKLLLEPKYDIRDINIIAEECPPPYSVELITNKIINEYGYSDVQAKNALRKMVEKNDVTISARGEVQFRQLTRLQAILNAALTYPDGAFTQNLYHKANTLGGLSEENSFKCGHNSICNMISRERTSMLYLCGVGKYRHVSFLGLTDDIIQDTIQKVKQALEDLRNSNNIDTANLRFNVFNPGQFALNFYGVRYIVKEYGEQHGIYFNGQSSNDTVSLAAAFEQQGQDKAIFDAIDGSRRPLTIDDLIDKLQPPSPRYLMNLLNKMTNSGELIKVSHRHFSTNKNAFGNYPVQPLIDLIERQLNKTNGCLPIKFLMSLSNTILRQNYGKIWYFSFAKYCIETQKKEWIATNDYISLASSDNKQRN